LTGENDLRILGRCALLEFGRFNVLVCHGHDMSQIGAFGHGWDRFVSRLGLEKLWKRLAKVDQDVWVILGHTHIPGVDATTRVANCGGWQSVIFVSPTRTGLLVSETADSPKLVHLAD
jgi:predicted phosphodiesterase